MQEVHMQQVNEQDAPTGFYAVHTPDASCEWCALHGVFRGTFSCKLHYCTPPGRRDGCYVVFKPNDVRYLYEANNE